MELTSSGHCKLLTLALLSDPYSRRLLALPERKNRKELPQMNKTNLGLHQETKLGESTASVNKGNEIKASNKEEGKHNAHQSSDLRQVTPLSKQTKWQLEAQRRERWGKSFPQTTAPLRPHNWRLWQSPTDPSIYFSVCSFVPAQGASEIILSTYSQTTIFYNNRLRTSQSHSSS